MTTAEMPQTAATQPGHGDVLLEVRGLKMHFPVTSGILFQRAVAHIKAIDGVDFTVAARRDAGTGG